MNSIKYGLIFLLSGLLLLPPVLPAEQYSRVITAGDYTYQIEVGGTRDPVNETIIIENLGDEPIVNPRITVDGRFDWFDIRSMAAEATRGCTTDEEKALGIWKFILNNFQHRTSPGDREAHNPVVALNVYGYANCSYHSTVFRALCLSVGIPARGWEVWHHTVSDAFYNDAWHMLDSDIGLYYLADDNRTIASMEQLWEDQKVSGGTEEGAVLTRFSGRNKAVRMIYTDAAGGNPFISQDGERMRGYRYFHGPEHCYIQTGWDRFIFVEQSMAMSLRPGEKLVRNWMGGEKYYDYERHNRALERGSRWAKPILYGDGQIIWKPELKSELAPSFFNRNQPPAFEVLDGQAPAVHVLNRQGGVYDVPTRAILHTETPYTILGGRLRATLHRGAATEWDRLTATVSSRTGPVREQVWSAPDGATGTIDAEIDLDRVLFPSGQRGRHDWTVEFNFMANESNDPPTQSGLESVELVTDIQVAPNSLPALSRGRNVIRYRDETSGEHKVRITHIWRERSDNNPPSAPTGAVYPSDGGVSESLAPEFSWSGASDRDIADTIADHWISISFDPQCRWPVATALLKVTGSGEPRWQLPEGWLNGDTTYYWKVRARDSRGVWGEWSPVFSFRTAK